MQLIPTVQRGTGSGGHPTNMAALPVTSGKMFSGPHLYSITSGHPLHAQESAASAPRLKTAEGLPRDRQKT